MFAAGLLLGFSVFVQSSGAGKETEEAFHYARAVLLKLSELSPQAGHYYQILTAFSDAIALHQQKLSQERKRKTDQYMDQIFTSGSDEQMNGNILDSRLDNTLTVPLHESEATTLEADLDSNGLTDYNMSTEAYGTVTSEGFPWPADDFGFDWQTCAPFLDDLF